MANKKTIKLLPCPFCGTAGIMRTRKSEGKFLTDIGCEILLCICWICTEKHCDCEPEGYCHKKDAIEAWNTRSK